MKKYEVIVAGETLTTCVTKEEAETKLAEARQSFLALVHPRDCFYIREK